MFQKLLNWFKPSPLSTKKKVERAFGLWQVERKGNAATFVSIRTGVPRDQVWPILLEKRID